jgi:hypothetical protein
VKIVQLGAWDHEPRGAPLRGRLAKALAEAVANYAAHAMGPPPALDAIQEGLHNLLYLRGSDGISTVDEDCEHVLRYEFA